MTSITINLEGELAMVTGASRGIGKSIAMALARAGAYVVGTATTEAGAEAISRCLSGAHLEGEGQVLDVRDGGCIRALLSDIKQRRSPVSILVNNAGITRDDLVLRMRESQWQEVIDTNLSAVFRVTKASLKDMIRARKGRIISITSVVGISGNGGQANYAASKAGVLAFTRSVAREVGPRGITVNAIAPGFIKTDMTAGLDREQVNTILAQQPIKRLGDPEDVANMVSWLASEKSAYVSGECFTVDGGMTAASPLNPGLF